MSSASIPGLIIDIHDHDVNLNFLRIFSIQQPNITFHLHDTFRSTRSIQSPIWRKRIFLPIDPVASRDNATLEIICWSRSPISTSSTILLLGHSFVDVAAAMNGDTQTVHVNLTLSLNGRTKRHSTILLSISPSVPCLPSARDTWNHATCSSPSDDRPDENSSHTANNQLSPPPVITFLWVLLRKAKENARIGLEMARKQGRSLSIRKRIPVWFPRSSSSTPRSYTDSNRSSSRSSFVSILDTKPLSMSTSGLVRLSTDMNPTLEKPPSSLSIWQAGDRLALWLTRPVIDSNLKRKDSEWRFSECFSSHGRQPDHEVTCFNAAKPRVIHWKLPP